MSVCAFIRFVPWCVSDNRLSSTECNKARRYWLFQKMWINSQNSTKSVATIALLSVKRNPEILYTIAIVDHTTNFYEISGPLYVGW